MLITKENAALAALEYIEDGMTLGLGSGSTAEIFYKAFRFASSGWNENYRGSNIKTDRGCSN